MKRSYAILALLAALAIGYVAGRGTAPAAMTSALSDAGKAGKRSTRLRAGEREVTEVSSKATARFREQIRKSKSFDLAPLVYKALEIGDPLLRRQMIYEIYASMDAGNFEQMILEANRVALETGRENYDEWLILHTRAGQVAGEAAMKRWTDSNKTTTEQALRTMWGWSSADPDAAKKWIDDQNLPLADRTKLLNSVMSGAISSDPEKAIRMLNELPEAERLPCVNQFTWHLVQNKGKEGALSWLQSVNASEPESAFAKSVATNVFARVISTASNQSNIPAMVSSMAQYSAIRPIDSQNLGRATSMIDSRIPGGGLTLLDEVAKNPSLADQPIDFEIGIAVGNAERRAPGTVERWLGNHPDSPIRGQIEASFAKNKEAANLKFSAPDDGQ